MAAKRLIICCDGTWQADDDEQPSNVARLHQLLVGQDPHGVVQRSFYQGGVGTDPVRGRLRRRMRRAAAGAFGWGLDEHIREAYRWLIREFEPGDELFLFGFSRGAYTVRSLTGLIRNCGLLLPRYSDLVDRAMKHYRARGASSHPDAPASTAFRSNYSHDYVRVRFLGVWDTVGALGIPAWFGMPARLLNRHYEFHDVRLSRMVERACHALAIDERRRSFKPSLWKQCDGRPREGIEQVWFAGVHGDVGGGYAKRGLSDLTLRWMVKRAKVSGLAVDVDRYRQLVNPDWCAEIHDSRWAVHHLPLVGQVSTAVRPISSEHWQFIHRSAAKRLRKKAHYAPPNLTSAVESGVPQTA